MPQTLKKLKREIAPGFSHVPAFCEKLECLNNSRVEMVFELCRM